MARRIAIGVVFGIVLILGVWSTAQASDDGQQALLVALNEENGSGRTDGRS